MPEEPILPIDDPRLRQPSTEVEAVDDDVRCLAREMFQIMERSNGAGLAAIQIGIPKRVIVIAVPDDKGLQHRYALINPEIIDSSRESRTSIEGCLSMPGYDIPVKRAERITVRYINIDGDVRHVCASGMLSICLQHEIDHVNGVLFIDRVSKLRRDRANSFFAKKRHALYTNDVSPRTSQQRS